MLNSICVDSTEIKVSSIILFCIEWSVRRTEDDQIRFGG